MSPTAAESVSALNAEVARLRRDVFAAPKFDASRLDSLLRVEEALAATAAGADALEIDSAMQSGAFVDTTSRSTLLGASTTGLDVVVTARMAQVPTAIVHLLDGATFPLVTGTITNVSDRMRRLRVITFVEGYSAQSVDTFEVDKRSKVAFKHLPTFYPDRMASVTELTRATLHLVVEDLGGERDDAGNERHWTTIELQQSTPIWLLPRSTAPMQIADPGGGWLDLSPYLAVFVTPNAPAVMEFVRRAVGRHPDKSMVGYQIGKQAVLPQIRAIFDALKLDAEINYVNSVISYSPDHGMFTQRVRRPVESLAEHQANCIDGTVLVASLVEACSMSPAIVLVPGHAFLAWESWDDSDEWAYLETTMIGNSTFDEAVAAATKEAEGYQALATKSKDPRQFRRLSVKEMRQAAGITPME